MKEKDQYFRANAGIVLFNERKEVLALEHKEDSRSLATSTGRHPN